MKRLVLLSCSLLSLLLQPLSANIRSDTLRTRSGSRIIVSYDVTTDGNQVKVTFKKPKPILGAAHKGKYERENLKVMLCDRNGNFGSVDLKDNGFVIHPFTVDAERLKYSSPMDDGFFFLGEELSELHFQLLTNELATVSIPLYLVYYEKKHRYSIIDECRQPLTVRFTKEGKQQIKSDSPNLIGSEELEQIHVDEEETFSKADEAARRLENFELQMASPISDDLKANVEGLRKLQYEVTDPRLQNRIADALSRYEEKERNESEQGKSDALKQQEQEQLEEARGSLELLQERMAAFDDLTDSDRGDLKALSNSLRRQSIKVKKANPQLAHEMKLAADDCDKRLKAVEDHQKRRNVWLIVGGILLAVLMFVGNQVMQHVRNARNMKSFTNAQGNIAKRAQDETRRRAESALRSRLNRVEGQARQQARKTVNDTMNSALKGKKIKDV